MISQYAVIKASGWSEPKKELLSLNSRADPVLQRSLWHVILGWGGGCAARSQNRASTENNYFLSTAGIQHRKGEEICRQDTKGQQVGNTKFLACFVEGPVCWLVPMYCCNVLGNRMSSILLWRYIWSTLITRHKYCTSKPSRLVLLRWHIRISAGTETILSDIFVVFLCISQEILG
jgi:hypothetical protein